MYGLKFFTSGLAFKDENSDVIGYEIHTHSGIEKVWLQPKETTHFVAITMEEYNGLTIAELKEVGMERDVGIRHLFQKLLSDEVCVCWFSEFIAEGVNRLLSERKAHNDFSFQCMDLLPIAKETLPELGNYSFKNVCEELEVFNLVDLFDKLCNLQTYKGVRRL